MVDSIKDALAGFTPKIADSYRAIVTGRFEAMTAKLGPFLRNIYNDWDFARVFTSTIRANVVNSPEGYRLDEANLARNASAYAVATVAAWEDKISAKLGELDEARVEAMSGYTFRILGTRAGRAVTIEQTMILNVSPKGKFFNQFPARIYVDGKFISEAKFKEIK